MNSTKPTGELVGQIGNRQVFFNKNGEEAIDWADTFARMIIGDDVEGYLVRNGLFKKHGNVKEAMATSQA